MKRLCDDLLALIERLAPAAGFTYYPGGPCMHCNYQEGVDATPHADDCPWAEARKVLAE